MTAFYPEYQPSYLIGVVGYSNGPLLDHAELARDAHILRAMDVQEIAVFYLGGALRDFGDDFVQRFVAAVNGADAPTARDVGLADLETSAVAVSQVVNCPPDWCAVPTSLPPPRRARSTSTVRARAPPPDR